jgi:hypothetical protein
LGTKIEKVAGGWKKLRNEECQAEYCKGNGGGGFELLQCWMHGFGGWGLKR